MRNGFISLQLFTVVTVEYSHNSCSLHMQIKSYSENSCSAITSLYSSKSYLLIIQELRRHQTLYHASCCLSLLWSHSESFPFGLHNWDWTHWFTSLPLYTTQHGLSMLFTSTVTVHTFVIHCCRIGWTTYLLRYITLNALTTHTRLNSGLDWLLFKH
jgi:hypothetical protein